LWRQILTQTSVPLCSMLDRVLAIPDAVDFNRTSLKRISFSPSFSLRTRFSVMRYSTASCCRRLIQPARMRSNSDARATGHHRNSGYGPSLASGTRCPALGLQPTPEERWTAASVARDRRTGASHCQRESHVGLRANSGRALQSRLKISTTTVANILKSHGIEPAPDRRRQATWKDFLQAHWDVLASVDFTTIAVWTKSGFITCYLLFVMELASRRVHFAGCTANPDESWMC